MRGGGQGFAVCFRGGIVESEERNRFLVKLSRCSGLRRVFFGGFRSFGRGLGQLVFVPGSQVGRAFGLDFHELLERLLEVALGGVDFALDAAEGVGALGVGGTEAAGGHVLDGAVELCRIDAVVTVVRAIRT